MNIDEDEGCYLTQSRVSRISTDDVITGFCAIVMLFLVIASTVYRIVNGGF